VVVSSGNSSTIVYKQHACTLKDLGHHFDKQYQYDVIYSFVGEEGVHSLKPGIPLSVLQWIDENTESDKWGWYFTQRHNVQYAIISFDSIDDAFWFRLSYKEGVEYK
jgi:hypothetical protein